MYFDTNDKLLQIYDIIDLHQTVNGQSQFVVVNIEPLDIRYKYDLNRRYEYDKENLLTLHFDITQWEIIGNIVKQ